MEIAIADNNEEDRMRDLYDAALKGCASTLNTLLQQDPLILHRVSSQTTFFETPLHKSALLGHLEFTKTLLAHYPKLALELDSFQSTPLHLASAQGHIDIVKELLVACGKACLVCNQEHRIPLHYAVIRGRRDVVKELIRAKKESLTLHDEMGKNIMHLCVMHNQLEILKDLVALDTNDTNNMLIEGDSDGKNTILHLAIMLKQVETVSYLISIPKIRSEASNLKNDMGYTSPDIVNRIPKDSKSLEIQIILMESGIKCGRTRERFVVASGEEERSEKKTKGNGSTICRIYFETLDKCIIFLGNIDIWIMEKGNWAEEMRGNLSMVATMLATITFPAIINPPGSVIQQGIRPSDPNVNLTSSSNTSTIISQGPLGCLNYRGEINGSDIGSALEACPGKAILAYRDPKNYDLFIIYNTVSFVASMIVVFVLVSGLPLRHKIVMWMLSLALTMAVMYLLNAYFVGLRLIAPSTPFISNVVFIANLIFNGLNVPIFMFITMTLYAWLYEKNALLLGKFRKRKLTKHGHSSE